MRVEDFALINYKFTEQKKLNGRTCDSRARKDKIKVDLVLDC